MARDHKVNEPAWRRAAAIFAVLAGAFAFGAAAHEIPSDVKINAFLKPAGDRLELLIRVPLAAMIEAEFPTRGPGYLDIARADDALRGAAKLYLIDNITITENDTSLPAPRIAVGEPANLVLLDLSKSWRVSEAGFRSRSANSWLLGETLQGQVVKTVADGVLVHG